MSECGQVLCPIPELIWRIVRNNRRNVAGLFLIFGIESKKPLECHVGVAF